MNLELTEQQQQALAGDEQPVRLVNPKTNTRYVLVPEEDYVSVLEAIQEEQQRKKIAQVALRNAAGRMAEDP